MTAHSDFAALLTAIDAGDDERCEALVQRLTPADSHLVIPLAADADSDRRWWAVRALALVGADNAVPALVSCLETTIPVCAPPPQ